MYVKTMKERLANTTLNAERERKDTRAFFRYWPDIVEFTNNLINTCPVEIYANVSNYWGGSFFITLYDLDSFKDEWFIDFLLAIENYFKVELTMTDVPERNLKQFKVERTWREGNNLRQLTITVEAQLKNDSDECKWVIIGETTKQVTKPIYKFICNDEATS